MGRWLKGSGTRGWRVLDRKRVGSCQRPLRPVVLITHLDKAGTRRRDGRPCPATNGC